MPDPLPAIYRRRTPARQAIPQVSQNFNMQAIQIDQQTDQQVTQAITTAGDVLASHYARQADKDHQHSLKLGQTQANNILVQARQQANLTKDPKQRRTIYDNAMTSVDKLIAGKDTDQPLFRQNRTKRAAEDWWKIEQENWRTESAMTMTEADSENIKQKPWTAIKLAVRSAVDVSSYAKSISAIRANVADIDATPEKRKEILAQNLVAADQNYANNLIAHIQDAYRNNLPIGDLATQQADDINDLPHLTPAEKQSFIAQLDSIKAAAQQKKAHQETAQQTQVTSWRKENAAKAEVFMAKNSTVIPPKMIEQEKDGQPVYDYKTQAKLYKAYNDYTAKQTKEVSETTALMKDTKLVPQITQQIQQFTDSPDGSKKIIFMQQIRARIHDPQTASGLISLLNQKTSNDPAGFEYKSYAQELEQVLKISADKDHFKEEYGDLDQLQRLRLYGSTLDQIKTVWQNSNLSTIEKRKQSADLIKPLRQEDDYKQLLRNLQRVSPDDIKSKRINTRPTPDKPTGYETLSDDELIKTLGL